MFVLVIHTLCSSPYTRWLLEYSDYPWNRMPVFSHDCYGIVGGGMDLSQALWPDWLEFES